MERKTRIWLGLSTAVLLGSTAIDQSAVALSEAPAIAPNPPKANQPLVPRIRVAQEEVVVEGGEGGEGEGGEGGGQVLGTIQEFRLQSTDPNAYQYDATAQVAGYVAHVHQSYVAAHAGASALNDAVKALLENPTDESLAAARQAWIDARPAYAKTEAFLFYAGPVDIPGGPVKRLNAAPVDGAFIEGLIADTATAINRANIVRADQIANAAHVTTGWHAIEYLLWGDDSGDGAGTRTAADFVAGQGTNDRRRDFLRIITQLLVNDLSVLVPAWAPDVHNNYAAAMVAMDKRNAIGRVFNGIAVLTGYEVALRRLGGALFPSQTERELSAFSDTTTADIAANLEGVRLVYFGTAPGNGFDTLLASIDTELGDRVVAAFATAEQAVAALAVPFDTIIASPSGSPERAAADAAVAALKDLASLLRAAGNRLGVLIVLPGV
jgi:putative iron-regulated protein